MQVCSNTEPGAKKNGAAYFVGQRIFPAWSTIRPNPIFSESLE